MKIPKYIDKLLEKRAKAATAFMKTDIELQRWLNENNILVSSDDVATGACSLCEPYSSIDSIRKAIRDSEV